MLEISTGYDAMRDEKWEREVQQQGQRFVVESPREL